MSYLEPWEEKTESAESDRLKRFVFQTREDQQVHSLPHVLQPLPSKQTVMGRGSPHQTGDLTSYDILIRGPLYCFASHIIDIAPHVPVRGVHRHIAAPTIFCLSGKGWEMNDGVTYQFETHDMVCFAPYSVHQHGGDAEVGCAMISLATRLFHSFGLMWREQHKMTEKPVFPDGTEPLYDADGKLRGYRIKKGVLGIKDDIEVVVGPEPKLEDVFQARKRSVPWSTPVRDTYERYLKLYHDEVQYLSRVDHVVHESRETWEWSRQGKLKWFVHSAIETGGRQVWAYLQEIPPHSRSGKHLHVAEEQVLVIEGNGYDIHDGARWNWQAGDFICIPRMTTHQHFNSGDSRVLLLCAMPSPFVDVGLGGIEQLEDAPEYPAGD
jgi:quercetin dioxygenase-like cupin family protein